MKKFPPGMKTIGVSSLWEEWVLDIADLVANIELCEDGDFETFPRVEWPCEPPSRELLLAPQPQLCDSGSASFFTFPTSVLTITPKTRKRQNKNIGCDEQSVRGPTEDTQIQLLNFVKLRKAEGYLYSESNCVLPAGQQKQKSRKKTIV